MNRKLVCLFLASVLGLTGCSLAKEEVVTKEPDRLVGVYLTTEYPDSNDGYWVEYGSFGADTEFGGIQLPNMILPAEYNEETEEFVFPGLDGYALFEATVHDGEDVYHTVQSDLMDESFHVTSTDFGDSFELSGILYVGEDTETTVWKANLVYQTADGMIYLDGSGNSYQGNEDGFSSKVEQSHTTTVNGEEGSTSTRVEFSIQPVEKLEKLLLHQYNEAGERIDTQELTFTAGDQIVHWVPDAAWAVVEEHFPDHVKRTAYDYPAEGAEDVTHTAIVLNEDHVGEAAVIFFHKSE